MTKIDSIQIHILQIEILFTEKDSAQHQSLIIKKDMTLELMELQLNVLRTLDIQLPAGKIVSELRLFTAGKGHQAFSKGRLICAATSQTPNAIQIPGGQATGMKLRLLNSLETEARRNYLLTFGLSDYAPVHLKSSGDCVIVSPCYRVTAVAIDIVSDVSGGNFLSTGRNDFTNRAV